MEKVEPISRGSDFSKELKPPSERDLRSTPVSSRSWRALLRKASIIYTVFAGLGEKKTEGKVTGNKHESERL